MNVKIKNGNLSDVERGSPQTEQITIIKKKFFYVNLLLNNLTFRNRYKYE